VVDRYTLQMVLEEPLASGLAVLRLVHAAVVPQDEVERLGGCFGHAPVGTGPFTFVRWESNQEKGYSYAIATAKRLLSEAGVSRRRWVPGSAALVGLQG
jgi:hypothetical protein